MYVSGESGVAVAVPSAPPQFEGVLVVVKLKDGGNSSIVTWAVALQPSIDVTVKVYVPAVTLPRNCMVVPSDQE